MTKTREHLPTLQTLLKLQALFAAISLAYLVTSALRLQVTGEALSAAPLLPSMLMFVAYIGCLFLPRSGRIRHYRVAMVVAILLFGGGGVVGNILRYLDSGLADYASLTAWYSAVAINAFGTVLNIMAALGWFRAEAQGR
jgi:hypothetical protein